MFRILTLLFITGLYARSEEKSTVSDVVDKLSKEFATFMQYSVSIYCPSTLEKRWVCGSRCEGPVANSVVDVGVQDKMLEGTALVAYQESMKRIVVVFRGTVAVQSALANIDIRQVNADFQFRGLFKRSRKDAKVHRGFQNIYARIRPTIQESLKRLAKRFPDFQVIFTGHSMGGGVASMAAVDFHEQNPGNGRRISIYTFGQPRTGNKEWAAYVQTLPFASRYYRINHQGDPVPHVPLISMGYCHAGTHYKLNDKEVTSKCPTSGPFGESNECMSAIFQLWFPKHIIGYYGWWTYPWFC